MKELKKLAEALDYETDDTLCYMGKPDLFVRKDSNAFDLFEPLYNAEQCLEIMEHYKMCVAWVEEAQAWGADYDYSPIFGEGKTIQEAVLNCALEIIK